MDTGLWLIIISAVAVFAVIVFLYSKKGVFGPKDDSKGSRQITELRAKLGKSLATIEKLKNKNRELQYRLGNVKSKNRMLRTTGEEIASQTNKLSASRNNFVNLKAQKEEMLRMVHDIKNPAAAIKNFVSLINSYELTVEEQSEVMELLIKSSERLMRISEAMTRTLSEESESFNINYTDCEINKLLKNCFQVFSIAAENKKIKLEIDADEKLSVVQIDEVKIEEVIENILDNAIKYSPENTKILVTSQKVDDFLEISIEDQGLGIAEQDFERIFQKGMTTKNVPTGGETNTGIGLWIVKTIVEAHNGIVKVSSREGVGSKFTITLPIKKPAS